MQSNPTVVLEPNSSKQVGDSTVVMGNVSGNSVSDIIFFNEGNGDEETIIVAGDSVLTGAKDEGVLLQLDMSDALMITINSNKPQNYEIIETEKIITNLFDSTFSVYSGLNPREMTFIDLRKDYNIIMMTNFLKLKKNLAFVPDFLLFRLN